MVIFKEFYKNPLGQNKNDNESYSFSKDNYNNGVCGSGYTLTGDIPQGDATYDAARANMGEPWMMPTKTQCEELINNTNFEWITINKINGGKFTSKTDSSKYIFLPPAGEWYEINRSAVGRECYYRTAMLNSNITSNAWVLYFYSGDIYMHPNMIGRTTGASIRPIAPPKSQW